MTNNAAKQIRGIVETWRATYDAATVLAKVNTLVGAISRDMGAGADLETGYAMLDELAGMGY